MSATKKLKMTVIGCGWLGLPLCKKLQESGSEVITTASTALKVQLLSSQLNALEFKLENSPDDKLLHSDVLIYTIPPKDLKLVETFFSHVNPDQRIIFISSTSVYGKTQGHCDENSPKHPESTNGMLLLKSEEWLKKRFKQLTIIRPGGLYGQNRHPINFLQGKIDLANGEELTHLIHQENCIEAIMNIIKFDQWNEEFNLINDVRITKENYYTDTACLRGLIAPMYISSGKKSFNQTNLSNEKSKRLLFIKYNND